MVAIFAAVEGPIDEAVLRRLFVEVGAVSGPIYGKEGKGRLRARINGYNSAAVHSPWVVLVDLDDEFDCAPELRAAWLPSCAPNLCFRVAVRQVETWLLADRARIASFLAVPIARIPVNPESESNSKQAMINLAVRSKRRQIRDDMVPRPSSGRSVGPAYTSRLIEFISHPAHGWRPLEAAKHSDSLLRAIECLRQLVAAT